MFKNVVLDYSYKLIKWILVTKIIINYSCQITMDMIVYIHRHLWIDENKIWKPYNT